MALGAVGEAGLNLLRAQLRQSLPIGIDSQILQERSQIAAMLVDRPLSQAAFALQILQKLVQKTGRLGCLWGGRSEQIALGQIRKKGANRPRDVPVLAPPSTATSAARQMLADKLLCEVFVHLPSRFESPLPKVLIEIRQLPHSAAYDVATVSLLEKPFAEAVHLSTQWCHSKTPQRIPTTK